MSVKLENPVMSAERGAVLDSTNALLAEWPGYSPNWYSVTQKHISGADYLLRYPRYVTP